MGLFKSLRGNHPEYIGGQPSSDDNRKAQSHAETPGLPPSSSMGGYVPPKGPPPSYGTSKQAESQAGSSVAQEAFPRPPPYHDWTSIPDTSLLPAPPALWNKFSPTGNAEESEAVRAHEWCARYPLMQPHAPTSAQIEAVRLGQLDLQQPQEYRGKLQQTSPGAFRGSAKADNKDACLISSLPLYFVMSDSPFRTGIPKAIYFEVKIINLGASRTGDQSSLAIGFCGVPYPTWRMPGWERGSLAVHSDDGRRYVSDTDGGIDFARPFSPGETVGLGLKFSISETATRSDASLKGEAFFTRNGALEKGWQLQEELDSNNQFGVLGVDGKYDLFGAIGIFGEVSFEVSFNRRDWLWQPK